jgi:glyoxylate carboligase
MMQMTGAELIVKLLERQDIRTIAGVPGGAALPMYDALSKSEQIHHVLCRHEQGALASSPRVWPGCLGPPRGVPGLQRSGVPPI